MDTFFGDISSEVEEFFRSPNAMRSLAILALSIIGALLLSKIVALFVIRLARIVANVSDNSTDAEKKVRLRRLETYLSVLIAIVRVLIVGFVAFYAWKVLSPTATVGIATVGASAFFIVLAGGTIGSLLRDITAGASMIVEGWYNVGDYIEIEPFLNISGVVERITLRSTRLRNLKGEIIWVHNQHIQSIRLTPNGLRTFEIDVFARSEKAGDALINKAIATLPTGTTRVARAPTITQSEKWGISLWRFAVVAQTAPGREWLIENHFVQSLHDSDDPQKPALVRPPIVRYVDEAAERSFKRSVK